MDLVSFDGGLSMQYKGMLVIDMTKNVLQTTRERWALWSTTVSVSQQVCNSTSICAD
jgi:hypothetical protein